MDERKRLKAKLLPSQVVKEENFHHLMSLISNEEKPYSSDSTKISDSDIKGAHMHK